MCEIDQYYYLPSPGPASIIPSPFSKGKEATPTALRNNVQKIYYTNCFPEG
jgi:hypothetical protein